MKAASIFLFLFLICTSVHAQSEYDMRDQFLQNSTGFFNSIDLNTGISTPTGDFETFAKQGFNSGLTFSKSFCDLCAMDLDLGYSSFQLSDEFALDSLKDTQWNLLSLVAGPVFQFKKNRFSFEAYGKAGLGLMNTPFADNSYENTGITITKFEDTRSSVMMGNLGLKLGFEICEGLNVFFNTELTRLINSDFSYQTRDVSRAVTPIGTIDPDILRDTPMESQKIEFSSYKLNVGFRIGLNKPQKRSQESYNYRIIERRDVGSGTRAQDYNSSRSNNESSVIILDTNGDDDIILRKRPGRGMDSSGDNPGSGTRAQDYNSSRSNNDGIAVDLGDGEDIILRKRPGRSMDGSGGGEGSGTRAQDYNSSRSNNINIAVDLGGGDDLILRKRPGRTTDGTGDGDGGGSRAQDYNSSRSNNSSITIDLGDGNDLVLRKRPGRTMDDSGDGESSGSRAQDYNSSRSNNESSVIYIDVEDGEDLVLRKRPGRSADDGSGGENSGNRAQDYNSSRSNNESSIVEFDGEDIILRKRPGRVMGDGSGDQNEGGTRARDYNSSRSNNDGIAVDLDNGEDLILRKRPGRSADGGVSDFGMSRITLAFEIDFTNGRIYIYQVDN